MIKDRVSIIIPTYGRAELLERAIYSVLKQTYQDIEVVVVDDNGVDTEKQIETELRIKKIPNVKYIKLENNLGAGLARNTGVNYSTGEYISFLDDDDVYYTNKIEAQLNSVHACNADVCLCDMQMINHGVIHFGEEYSYAAGTTLQEFLECGVAFTPMIFVRKEKFLEAGGFLDTPKFQDHTLMLNLFMNDAKVIIHREKLFEHHSYNIERVSNSSKSLKGYLIRYSLENKIIRTHALNKTKIKLNQLFDLRYFIREKRGVLYNIKYLFIAKSLVSRKEEWGVLFFLYKDYIKFKLKGILSRLSFNIKL